MKQDELAQKTRQAQLAAQGEKRDALKKQYDAARESGALSDENYRKAVAAIGADPTIGLGLSEAAQAREEAIAEKRAEAGKAEQWGITQDALRPLAGTSFTDAEGKQQTYTPEMINQQLKETAKDWGPPELRKTLALQEFAPKPVPDYSGKREVTLADGTIGVLDLATGSIEKTTGKARLPAQTDPGWEIKESTNADGEAQFIRLNKLTGEVRPVIGATPKSTGGMSGREAIQTKRIVMAGNQIAKDLSNVSKMPLTASTGLFGGRQQGHSLFEANKEVLANEMTSQEAQTYNVISTGFQRNLAGIEAAGLMPSGTLTKQMESIIFKTGDTNITKLHKLAQVRQIADAGLETILMQSKLSPSQKDDIEGIRSSLEKSIPFTQEDLINLDQQQQVNKNTTLKDIIKAKGKIKKGTDPSIEAILNKHGVK